MLSALFDQLIDEPNRIPEKYLSLIDDQGLEQSIADYVASMTDRYVLKLHREWFEP
jgi:dGTP triphosphohydrolase